MKLQTALKLIVLIAMVLGCALVSYSGNAATHRGIGSGSPFYPGEMKSREIELASNGVQIGQA